MALQPITHTSPSPAPDSLVPQGESVAPAGMPNLDNKSPEELAKMLEQTEQGGIEPTPDPEQQANQQAAEAAKVEEQKAQKAQKAQKQAPQEIQIPDKFKNQDGSLNTEALIKSQSDGQSYASQVKNEIEQLKEENLKLLQMGDDFQKELNGLQSAPAQPGQTPMTPEQVDEYNANPQAYVDKLVDKKMQTMDQKIDGQRKEGQRDRMLDFKVNNEISKIKSREGYKELEEDIDGILKSNLIGWDPRGPELAYYAARGMKTTEMVVEAKNQGFNEGYSKHKEEIDRQVAGGGASTLPAGGVQLDDATLDKMTGEEMIQAGLINVHPSK